MSVPSYATTEELATTHLPAKRRITDRTKQKPATDNQKLAAILTLAILAKLEKPQLTDDQL
jgi:hypothetical protein